MTIGVLDFSKPEGLIPLPNETILTITQASDPQVFFEKYREIWRDLAFNDYSSPFFSPSFQEIWWRNFGNDQLFVGLSVIHEGRILAIISLYKDKNDVLTTLGEDDLFDHRGFACQPGFEILVCEKLIQWLGGRAFRFGPMVPENKLYCSFLHAAKKLNIRVSEESDELAPCLSLPETFVKYLSELPSKDRHELRRKMRGISNEFHIKTAKSKEDPLAQKLVEDFIRLVAQSSRQKMCFMTPQRAAFFRNLANALNLDGKFIVDTLFSGETPVASLFGFSQGKTYFLYNSGLNLNFRHLSPGIALLGYRIKNCIEDGFTHFDFLRGEESYKYFLGGKPRQLMRLFLPSHNGDNT